MTGCWSLQAIQTPPSEAAPPALSPPKTQPGQGAGQNHYAALIRWYQNDTLAPAIPRPAYYAYVAWSKAVRSDSRMLPVTFGPGANASAAAAAPAAPDGPPGASGAAPDGLKVWPLWGEAERELRVVVINKRPSEAGEATIRVASDGAKWGDASVERLAARGDAPLEARGAAITLGGITYGLGGRLQGREATETVARADSEGRPAWKVYMPAGSAAIVTIKRLG